MCLRVTKEKNMGKKYFFASLKSLKKGVGGTHQNVTDAQHCF